MSNKEIETIKIDKVEMIPLFRKDDLAWIRQKGDDALDFNEIFKGIGGTIAEAGDGIAIGMFAKQMNVFLSSKLSNDVKTELHDVFDNIKKEDYIASLKEVADVIAKVVENKDIPEKVKPWVNVFLEIYRGILTQLEDKRKKKEAEEKKAEAEKAKELKKNEQKK